MQKAQNRENNEIRMQSSAGHVSRLRHRMYGRDHPTHQPPDPKPNRKLQYAGIGTQEHGRGNGFWSNTKQVEVKIQGNAKR